ncbi:MAG: type II toxin-antitoxin system RelE/ParE family toxin [Defluviitaleaceae bacterium]|nr:type II toxin-antitoxin system RelE/ParE family toxin [Defluviitaleaceae bacterium]
MEYSARYRKAAVKFLDSQTSAVRKRIMDAVDKLPAGNVKKLTGREGFRLAVGAFRILYDITSEPDNDGKTIIFIKSIGSRGDVYK